MLTAKDKEELIKATQRKFTDYFLDNKVFRIKMMQIFKNKDYVGTGSWVSLGSYLNDIIINPLLDFYVREFYPFDLKEEEITSEKILDKFADNIEAIKSRRKQLIKHGFIERKESIAPGEKKTQSHAPQLRRRKSSINKLDELEQQKSKNDTGFVKMISNYYKYYFGNLEV